MKKTIKAIIGYLGVALIIISPAYALEGKNDFSSIIGFAHTIFMKADSKDEISIYFSIINKEKKNKEKVFDIVIFLYKEFNSDGYGEIPATHPIPPRNTIHVDIVQRPWGIEIYLSENRTFKGWKLFVGEKAEDIAKEVIEKLREVEI